MEDDLWKVVNYNGSMPLFTCFRPPNGRSWETNVGAMVNGGRVLVNDREAVGLRLN